MLGPLGSIKKHSERHTTSPLCVHRYNPGDPQTVLICTSSQHLQFQKLHLEDLSNFSGIVVMGTCCLQTHSQGEHSHTRLLDTYQHYRVTPTHSDTHRHRVPRRCIPIVVMGTGIQSTPRSHLPVHTQIQEQTHPHTDTHAHKYTNRYRYTNTQTHKHSHIYTSAHANTRAKSQQTHT